MSLILTSGKQDLVLQQPILNSAGMLGFSDELRAEVALQKLGALITNPISLHPRTPAGGQRLVHFDGGILMHTGLANPGMSQVIEKHRMRWRRMPCPVVLHLFASHPDDMRAMVTMLDSLDDIHGLEIGLLDEDPDLDSSILEAACASLLPVIGRLPLDIDPGRAIMLEQIGTAAIALGPPRGAISYEGELITGRLYGPCLLPQILRAVSRISTLSSLPVIAGAGVYARSDIDALINAGSVAVELDTVLWTKPDRVLNTPDGSAEPLEC